MFLLPYFIVVNYEILLLGSAQTVKDYDAYLIMIIATGRETK